MKNSESKLWIPKTEKLRSQQSPPNLLRSLVKTAPTQMTILSWIQKFPTTCRSMQKSLTRSTKSRATRSSPLKRRKWLILSRRYSVSSPQTWSNPTGRSKMSSDSRKSCFRLLRMRKARTLKLFHRSIFWVESTRQVFRLCQTCRSPV